ncbi:MAG: molybdopterin-synthase adenylyltransferase MoeB [Candidatus Kapaibacterium sp.]
MLSKEEKYRYSRHLLLDNVGIKGQEKLSSASVLVVGAGGLSCPALQYLTASGVGRIGIIDDDLIEESNLQRQVLYSHDDIGRNKAFVASEKLSKQNPFVSFEIQQTRLTNKNALELFSRYDIILDGTDNFATRYIINDACVILGKPFVYGSIYKFEGQVSVFNYNNGPSYRCLFPNPPSEVGNCSEVGVLGVLPGIIGIMQSIEVIKIILDIGSVLSGKLLIYDGLSSDIHFININKSQEYHSELTELKNSFEEFDYEFFCSNKNGTITCKDISAESLEELLKSEIVQIVDVRQEWELPKIPNHLVVNIPMDEISNSIHLLDKSKYTVICCQTGVRSKKCLDTFEKEGFVNLYNLKNGIVSWQK